MSRPLQSCECFRQLCCASGAVSVHRSPGPEAAACSGALPASLSARQSSWPLDWPIEDLQAAGLPQPCVVRLKLFTLDERLVLGPLGALADGDRAAVIAQLAKLFGNPGPEVG